MRVQAYYQSDELRDSWCDQLSSDVAGIIQRRVYAGRPLTICLFGRLWHPCSYELHDGRLAGSQCHLAMGASHDPCKLHGSSCTSCQFMCYAAYLARRPLRGCRFGRLPGVMYPLPAHGR